MKKKTETWFDKTTNEAMNLSRDILMINVFLLIFVLNLIGMLVNTWFAFHLSGLAWANLVGISMVTYASWVAMQKFAYFESFEKKALKQKKAELNKLLKKIKEFP